MASIKSLLEKKRAMWVGLSAGAFLAIVGVLISGFIFEYGTPDTFCASCHVMEPFRMSWQEEVHGGNNPKGVTAQCVNCHLPHEGFIKYFTVKTVTGTKDLVMNAVIDGAEFDWAANAKENVLKFTYDSACRNCHHNLTPPGIPFGGLIAHRTYLRGDTTKRCVECHPRVGHKDMIETANNFFDKS